MSSKPRARVTRRKLTTFVELLLKGARVSWLTVHHVTVRIGRARLRTGGIGGVGTDPGHRFKGYSRACMEKSLEVMAGRRFHLSMLFGIGNFYPKWGFASVIPDSLLAVPTREAEEAVPPAGLRVVPFDANRHTVPMIRLYSATNASRSGIVERPGPVIRGWLKDWEPFQKGSYWDARVDTFVVLDRGRNVVGYAAHDVSRTEVTVVDAGYADSSVFPAIVAELARLAIARRAGDITLLLPIDHGLARYLHRFNVSHRVRYHRNSNGMARIIRLHDTLRDCSEELSCRLSDSSLAAKAFSLALETDIGKLTLQAARGRLRVVPGVKARLCVTMPQDRLTQLLFGYRSVEDVAGDRDVSVPGEAVRALSALFPSGFPHVYECDQF